MKAGYVALIGRTNAGKSTLLNTILQQKVSITSPKPKTTQFSVRAVYEDDRGQIIFIDTPGMSRATLGEDLNAAVYVIDQTRKRGLEENTEIGIMRKLRCPKILVYNKIDLSKQSYKAQYRFLESEVDTVLEVSAITGVHIKHLLEVIFSYLPEQKALVKKQKETPLLNIDSKTYISELIREKVFLNTGQEVPYQVKVITDEIKTRKNGTLYIQARLITTNNRYKKMLIGSEGRKIKAIGYQTRKELELSSNKKVYLELTVISHQ
jgi:GTP-binding protein Era